MSLSTSKSVTQRGTSYDINRRAVYHAIETGSGYEGLAAFCSIMNMPCLTKAAYHKQVENILEALENEANEEMRNAAERLRQHILDENPEKDEQDEVFEEWLLEYECDINFAGSSPAMESEGASVLWGRSIDHHNLRYKWMVCDGDSKAFNSVEHVYGETKVVGHVQKRMGKHLLNLKSRTKGKLPDGQPIGGRERLTEGKIKQLQKYYGLAIRQNTIKKSNPRCGCCSVFNEKQHYCYSPSLCKIRFSQTASPLSTWRVIMVQMEAG